MNCPMSRAVDYRALQVGDHLPEERDRPLFGVPCAPRWFILTVAPLAEVPVSAQLERFGATECWFPAETAWRRIGNSDRKAQYLRRIAPGYLFLLTEHEVAWDLMRERTLDRVRQVVGTEAGPLAIPPAAIAEMQHVPKRIEALHAQAETERARRAEARQVTGPCRARVTGGPFEGFVVDVTSIHAGIARFLVTLFGRETPADAPVTAMTRVDMI